MIGDILHKDVPLWTPWMPCPADNAVFMIELIATPAGLSILGSVFTKKRETTGTPSSATATWTASGVDFHPKEVTGLLELYRLKIENPARLPPDRSRSSTTAGFLKPGSTPRSELSHEHPGTQGLPG